MGRQVFTSSGSWNWPSNVTQVTVEAIGGGGAGAYCAGNPATGGGGKGGSYAKKLITKGAEASLTITVGDAGTSVIGGASTHGLASTVTQGASTVLSAAGGQTPAQDSGTGATAINGANTGDTIWVGGNGGNSSGAGGNSGAGGGAAGATANGGAGSGTTAGPHGGGAFLDGVDYCGAGGAGVAVRNAGNIGNLYGGAGSGGSTNQTSDKAGGQGTKGVVVLNWIDPPVAVGAVAASFTGQAPTAVVTPPSENIPRAPGVGSSAFTGRAPALALAVVVAAGSLGLGGLAPKLQITVLVPSGSMVTASAAPVLGRAFSVAGFQFTFSGMAPVVIEETTGVSRSPDTGSIAISGQSPVLAFTQQVPAAGIEWTGSLPTLQSGITISIPGTGNLRFKGPQRPIGDRAAAPDTGALALFGGTPTRSIASRILNSAGSLQISGNSAEVHLGIARTPAAASLVYTGLAPYNAVGYSRSLGAGSLEISGAAPGLNRGIRPENGVLTLNGLAAAVGRSYAIAPNAGSLVLSGQAPAIQILTHGALEPATVSLTLGGQAPAVRFGYRSAAGSGAFALSGQAPATYFGYGRSLPVAALALNGQTPNVLASQSGELGTAELALSGLAPSLGFGISISVASGDLTVDGYPPAAVPGTACLPAAGSLTLTGLRIVPPAAVPIALVSRLGSEDYVSGNASASRVGGAAAAVTQLGCNVSGNRVSGAATAVASVGAAVFPAITVGGSAIVLGESQPPSSSLIRRPGAGVLTLQGLLTSSPSIICRPGTGAITLQGLPTSSPSPICRPATAAMALRGSLGAPPPPPIPGHAHDYYNYLLTLPTFYRAYSCRDNAQLQQYAQTSNRPYQITYDPVGDPDPRKQDAGKVLVFADQTSIQNQVRFPINQSPGHSYLFTWDYWMGSEWAFSHTSMGNSKQFNVGKPSDASYLLIQSTYNRAVAGTVALFTIRAASPDYEDATIWPPPGQEHYVYPERWTRVWYHITPNADGTYHTNVWFADTLQEPVQAYTDIRFTYPPAGEAIGKFWLEYATSQNPWDIPPGRGELVSYVRNVVILIDHPLADIPVILQKPLAG